MHQIAGRMWTPEFNKEFQAKYGYSPVKFYPALFGDIGPETAAARKRFVRVSRGVVCDQLRREDNATGAMRTGFSRRDIWTRRKSSTRSG